MHTRARQIHTYESLHNVQVEIERMIASDFEAWESSDLQKFLIERLSARASKHCMDFWN